VTARRSFHHQDACFSPAERVFVAIQPRLARVCARKTPLFPSFGGWVETVTYANGMTSTEHSDVFGRDLWKLDMGGHAFQSVFDGGGRLVRREGGETLHFNVLNTGLVGTVSNGYGSHSRYAYDAAGNRTVEYTERNGAVVQNATAGYDNLGRLTHWNEHGNGTTHGASVIHDYDAAGNIRRTRASTPVLDQQGNFSYQSNTDQWYRFDAMNRVVTQKGQLVGGQIVRGSFGTDYTYDQAGQRRSATRTASRSASIYNPNYNPEPYYDPWGYNYPREPMYGDQYMTVYYDAVVREDYAYDAAGGLSQVRIAESGYQDNMDGTLTVTAAPWTGALKAGYWQDVLGRNFRQIDYLFNGDSNGTAAYDREVNYDGKGQIYREMTFTRSGADTIASETWNEYNGALGAVTGTTAHTWKNGSFQATARTDTNYAWYDGAVASTVRHRASSSAPTFTTSYYYDGKRRADLGLCRRRAPALDHLHQRHGRAGDPPRRAGQPLPGLQPPARERRPARDLVPVRGQADGLLGQQRHHRHRLRQLDRGPHPRRAHHHHRRVPRRRGVRRRAHRLR
jgi:YD repeat-containing protein